MNTTQLSQLRDAMHQHQARLLVFDDKGRRNIDLEAVDAYLSATTEWLRLLKNTTHDQAAAQALCQLSSMQPCDGQEPAE